MATDKNDHQNGNECDGKNGGEGHGECFCPGERARVFLSTREGGTSCPPALREEKQAERDEDDQERKENRRAYLLRPANENGFPIFVRNFGARLGCRCHTLRQVAIAVFNHDDGGVDKDTNGERQTAE